MNTGKGEKICRKINEKVIAPYIKGGKITTKLLQKAMKIFLPEIKKQAAERMRKKRSLVTK